jgi:chorismate mutase/prephenate dehydratase
MKNEITKLRKEIDAFDTKIISLLNQRAKRTMRIASLKEDLNLPIYDPAREQLLLKNLKRLNQGPLSNHDIESIMTAVLHVYRNLVRQLKIAYFGPEGTFTHLAALENFGDKAEYLPTKNIEGVFHLVEKEKADFGVVPVENSLEGVVTHTLDMFSQSELTIIAEAVLDVHHYLVSKEKNRKNIKTIFSHPQPLAQCKNYLRERFPNISIVETDSTSAAAIKVKKTAHTAAITSLMAAKLYQLNILDEKIEDSAFNATRFLIIGKSIPAPTGNDKTSVLFSIKDKVGALHELLVPFMRRGINLTKIESRPSKTTPWKYLFFLDFEGYYTDTTVKEALDELAQLTLHMKILGSYPRGD